MTKSMRSKDEYVIGYDHARGSDSGVVVVRRSKDGTICQIRVFRKRDYRSQMKEIQKIMKKYKVENLYDRLKSNT